MLLFCLECLFHHKDNCRQFFDIKTGLRDVLIIEGNIGMSGSWPPLSHLMLLQSPTALWVLVPVMSMVPLPSAWSSMSLEWKESGNCAWHRALWATFLCLSWEPELPGAGALCLRAKAGGFLEEECHHACTLRCAAKKPLLGSSLSVSSPQRGCSLCNLVQGSWKGLDSTGEGGVSACTIPSVMPDLSLAKCRNLHGAGSRTRSEEGIHWFHCFQRIEELRLRESNRKTACSHQPFYHTHSVKGKPQKCFPMSSSPPYLFFFLYW